MLMAREMQEVSDGGIEPFLTGGRWPAVVRLPSPRGRALRGNRRSVGTDIAVLVVPMDVLDSRARRLALADVLRGCEGHRSWRHAVRAPSVGSKRFPFE